MRFVSYSLNFEDVLLWRVLGSVKNGFYIDVGANDPQEFSVTKAFYDRGWHGVNIEPLPSLHAALQAQRKRDINLAVAAGNADGDITLFDVPTVNGWASADAQVARMHAATGLGLVELKVPVRRLAAICDEHVRGDIHFLKVDVEGFEEQVLRGMDFARWRPWVLVVEATIPNSREPSHEAWEHLVTDQGYMFAYFDGLNRYYVALEHSDLLPALAIQPNVFDDFVTAELALAWENAQRAAQAHRLETTRLSDAHTKVLQQLADSQARIQDLAQELAQQAHAHAQGLAQQAHAHAQLLQGQQADAYKLKLWAQGLEQRVVAMESSLSWRLMAPLHFAAELTRRLLNGEPGRLMLGFMTNQTLKKWLLPLVLRVPSLEARVRRVMTSLRRHHAAANIVGLPRASDTTWRSPVNQPLPEHHLPRSTQKILADLIAAADRTPRP